MGKVKDFRTTEEIQQRSKYKYSRSNSMHRTQIIRLFNVGAGADAFA